MRKTRENKANTGAVSEAAQKQTLYLNRVDAVSKLERKYTKMQQALDEKKRHAVEEAEKKADKNYKAALSRLKKKMDKEISDIDNQFPVDKLNPIQKLRLQEIGGVYEGIYLKEHQDVIGHLNQWKKLCDDDNIVGKYNNRHYFHMLEQEFIEVILPTIRKLKVKDIDSMSISFHRHFCNKIRACDIPEAMDECKEPVKDDYYVEFVIKDLDSLSQLITVLNNAYVYHFRDGATAYGRDYPWYVVFTYPSSGTLILRLYWENYWDPIYKLGQILSSICDNSKALDEKDFNTFKEDFERKIRPMSPYPSLNCFLSLSNFWSIPDDIGKKLFHKYFDGKSRKPRKKLAEGNCII
ncbi:MAG: hypothetical protein J6Y02_04470 [Pseudobutyrivibrio sp.]|nr:hypothetical protein [Pseudobutyrivibrio sp.]